MKESVKQGGSLMELPDDCSKFLANQLAFTYDLIKKGNKLTPGYLGILLANKTFGIADLVLGKRFDCGFAILFLGSSLTKADLDSLWSLQPNCYPSATTSIKLVVSQKQSRKRLIKQHDLLICGLSRESWTGYRGGNKRSSDQCVGRVVS